MDIVIIEKKLKIGEVNGQRIDVWQFFDAVKLPKIKEWCINRGFPVPKFGVNMYIDLDTNFRCHLWAV